MSFVLSFPRLPTHGGTCTTTAHVPACDQLGSWGGCRHSGDCNLGVCPGGKAPLSVEREERSSPGPTRVMGRRGLGGLVTLVPSPHPQPLASDGPGFGEGAKMVPTPVHTGPSSSLPPELPRGPCPSPCCAIWQDTEKSRQQAAQREGIAHGFQNRIDGSPGPRPGSLGPRVRRLSSRGHTSSWGEEVRGKMG